MSEMSTKDKECFKTFLAAYDHQYKLNSYAREAYDEDLEYYTGYRNENKYPLPYNMFFNKLLPRVQNVLARFMEHLYQGGTDNLVSVAPRTRDDVERAPKVEGLLNFQLDNLNSVDMNGGAYIHNFTWMFNALTWGKGIAKMYWRKEDRITPRRVSVPIVGPDGNIQYSEVVTEQERTVYDAPYSEVLHNKMFVPHPYYKSIEKMPFVFCVYSRSIDEIKKMADAGIYNKSAVRNIGWTGPRQNQMYSSGNVYQDSGEAFAKSLSIEGEYYEEFSDNRVSPFVDVIEGYGRYIFPEDETAYEVGSGVKIKGKESDAVVKIGNYKTLLSVKKWIYGKKPFFDISGYYHPELFWDIGMIRLGKSVQEQYNTLGNARFSNAIMLVNQMIKVKKDADIDPAHLVWRPYGIVPVEEMTDVEPLLTPDVSQSSAFREQEQFFESVLSEMTGETPYSLGQVPQRQEFVGTMYSLQQVGQARAKLLLMTMDYQGFKPFLEYMMLLNTYHLPPEQYARITGANGNVDFNRLLASDIHPNYDFSVRYTSMEPALGKQLRMQQLIQYAQMWQGSPYLQQYQFMKSVLEMMDFQDSDKYLIPPQQVQQQQQQQQQQQAQMQMAGAAVQDNLAENNAKRELTRDIVKGLLKQ